MSDPSTERIEVSEINKLTNAVKALTAQSIERGVQLTQVLSTQKEMKKDITEIKDARSNERVADALLKRDVDDLIEAKKIKETNTQKVWVGITTKFAPYAIFVIGYVVYELLKK